MNKLDIQGHRGCRGLLPENSIPAFKHAADLGVTTLELDVVVSKDKEIIVSHDPWMSATICSHPNGDSVKLDEEKGLRLYDMTVEEIQYFDCGKRGHPYFPQQQPMAVTKPTLKMVIAEMEKHVAENNITPLLYNIETKSRPAWDSVYTPGPEEFIRLLYKIIHEAGIKDRTTIQSFDVRTLEALRKVDKTVSTAFLVSNNEGLEANLKTLSFLPEIFSPNYLLTSKEEIQKARQLGMLVIPWTINTVEEMRQFIEWGVDGIITDYPDQLIKLLNEAGIG